MLGAVEIWDALGAFNCDERRKAYSSMATFCSRSTAISCDPLTPPVMRMSNKNDDPEDAGS